MYTTESFIKENIGTVNKSYTFIGGDAYSAPVVAVTQNGATNYFSILRDHLGSISHIVSSSGTVLAEYSFDPWGRMRDSSSWETFPSGSEPNLIIAGRGFTGHEHLPYFDIINMNGRLYDPMIAMFLSPDNNVQESDNTLNFNRYSYCLNNPLLFTDPSGYTWLRQFAKWLGNTGESIIIFAGGVVIVSYMLVVSAIGAVQGAVLGSLITINPIGTTIGAVAGGVGGFIWGAKTGIKAGQRFEKWVHSW